MVLNSENHFFRWHVQAFRHCLNNANVRLVRYQPIELFLGHTGFVERFLGNGAQRLYCDFEHFVALHDDIGLIRACLREIGGLTNGVIQQFLVLPVGTQRSGDNSRFV